MSPLGTTVARIIVESGVTTLTISDEESYTGTDLDEVMNRQLGFSLPLNYLYYWIQGIPLPQYSVTNRLTSGFDQLGWQVEYLSWQDINHPSIIRIAKSDLTVKLVINW